MPMVQGLVLIRDMVALVFFKTKLEKPLTIVGNGKQRLYFATDFKALSICKSKYSGEIILSTEKPTSVTKY